jgi:uncharacterized protein (DUF983 family)
LADASVSILRSVLTCRNPRCGRVALFRNLLELRESCLACGPDLKKSDAGDGGAAGVIMAPGAIFVGAAFWVEFHFAPPLWLHAVLWHIVTIPLAVPIMRPTKAALVALQYRLRSKEMGPREMEL